MIKSQIKITIGILFLLSTTVFAGKPPGESILRYDLNLKNEKYIQNGNGANFTFPVLSSSRINPVANIITNSSVGNLTNKRILISAIIQITSGNPVFTYYGEGTSWNPPITPPHYRLYFSSISPPYVNNPSCPSCYWWSYQSWTPLYLNYGGQGTAIAGDFLPEHWFNSDGESATNRLTEFNAALTNPKQFGIFFGGGSYFNNGVAIKPNTGTADFVLTSFSIDGE